MRLSEEAVKATLKSVYRKLRVGHSGLFSSLMDGGTRPEQAPAELTDRGGEGPRGPGGRPVKSRGNRGQIEPAGGDCQDQYEVTPPETRQSVLDRGQSEVHP